MYVCSIRPLRNTRIRPSSHYVSVSIIILRHKISRENLFTRVSPDSPSRRVSGRPVEMQIIALIHGPCVDSGQTVGGRNACTIHPTTFLYARTRQVSRETCSSQVTAVGLRTEWVVYIIGLRCKKKNNRRPPVKVSPFYEKNSSREYIF